MMSKSRIQSAILSTLALLVGHVHANDNFVDAVTLSGNFSQVNGSTVASTNEAGEPNFANLSSLPIGGVWYKWTAPSSNGKANVSLEVFDSSSSYFGYQHLVEVFLDQTGAIFDLVSLQRGVYVRGGLVGNFTFAPSPNRTYYFRVAYHSPASTPSPFQLTLNFSPIYETDIRFLTRARTLNGPTQTILAKVVSPDNATRVRVFSSGKGRESGVRYNERTGVVRFTHHRLGGRSVETKRAKRSSVRYTVVAYRGALKTGSKSKSFFVD